MVNILLQYLYTGSVDPYDDIHQYEDGFLPRGIFLTMVFSTGVRYNLPELMRLAKVAVDVHKDLKFNQDHAKPSFGCDYVTNALYGQRSVGDGHIAEVKGIRDAFLRSDLKVFVAFGRYSLQAEQAIFPAFLADLNEQSMR